MAGHNIQPLLRKNYLKATSAKGIYIFDQHGKKYLDGSSGAVTCSLGHSHPKILAFVKQQIDKLQFVYRSQFGSEEAEQLATKLYELSPEKAYAHAFFVNSGTEAVETAMKVAIQYWQEIGHPEKQQFISRWKSYHGITLGALSLSGHPLRRQRFEGALSKFPGLSSDMENTSLDVQTSELQRLIEKLDAHTIAAFIAEPMVGAAGTALTPKPEYYIRMKAICAEHQILFITDEVMTGLGRTGTWFGIEHWNTTADIAAIGKSLGAGYAPVAATLITESVLEPIRNGSGVIMSGHTYSGHPLSCATAHRVIEVIEEDQLLENVNQKGAFIKEGLMSLLKKFPQISTVRGKGLLMGVEFDPAIKGFQSKVLERCYENGLLVYPAVGGPEGKDENGILISPPFIISQPEAEELLQKLEQSFNEAQA
ncbi:MAG: aspartate aminotransferase family protein [Cytophagales bacterium]|nr:aspartate aminotransferase family protein [Cytophagales bacterium]